MYDIQYTIFALVYIIRKKYVQMLALSVCLGHSLFFTHTDRQTCPPSALLIWLQTDKQTSSNEKKPLSISYCLIVWPCLFSFQTASCITFSPVEESHFWCLSKKKKKKLSFNFYIIYHISYFCGTSCVYFFLVWFRQKWYLKWTNRDAHVILVYLHSNHLWFAREFTLCSLAVCVNHWTLYVVMFNAWLLSSSGRRRAVSVAAHR